ncbi:hypothetical protein HPP92_011209 [Vanilla planifolia]|uniref:Uncharacterized protein n=1 Tax=Vanilla planifolia TaxID=51239 RepID=A0A835R0E8_VANPL|nr:hypothetical protein HPP92_011209 [Vanilla planifolia]
MDSTLSRSSMLISIPLARTTTNSAMKTTRMTKKKVILAFLGDKLRQLNPAALAAANAKGSHGGRGVGGGGAAIGFLGNTGGGLGAGKKEANVAGGMINNQAGSEMRTMNGTSNNVKGMSNTLVGNGMMGMAIPQGLNHGFPQGQRQQTNMMNFQGSHAHPSSMMNPRNINPNQNLATHLSNSSNQLMNEAKYMQPQLMYNRSPQIPPYTGYYPYNSPSPYYYNYSNQLSDYGAQSEENTSGCAVM